MKPPDSRSPPAMIDEAAGARRRPTTTCVQKIANISNAQRSMHTKLSTLQNSTLLNSPVLSVFACSFAHLEEKHDRKLCSSQKRTSDRCIQPILVANESLTFPFGATALRLLGYQDLGNKKTAFLTGTHPQFCAPIECRELVYVAIDGTATWSPFCFDVTLLSLFFPSTLQGLGQMTQHLFVHVRLTPARVTAGLKRSHRRSVGHTPLPRPGIEVRWC